MKKSLTKEFLMRDHSSWRWYVDERRENIEEACKELGSFRPDKRLPSPFGEPAAFLFKSADFLFWECYLHPGDNDTMWKYCPYIEITDLQYKEIAMWIPIFNGQTNTWDYIIMSEQVALIFGVTERWAEKWASQNNVRSSGHNERKTYYWDFKDIKNFGDRNVKVGRPPKEVDNSKLVLFSTGEIKRKGTPKEEAGNG